MNINVASTIGHVAGPVMSYSYPIQTITLNCLNNSTTYSYCAIATNITDMMQVGKPSCGSFTTEKATVIEIDNNDNGTYLCS